jgi:hypothetical protein
MDYQFPFAGKVKVRFKSPRQALRPNLFYCQKGDSMDYESYHVEVYTTDGNRVCIRQELGGHEDKIILHPQQIPMIIKWLKILANDTIS